MRHRYYGVTIVTDHYIFTSSWLTICCTFIYDMNPSTKGYRIRRYSSRKVIGYKTVTKSYKKRTPHVIAHQQVTMVTTVTGKMCVIPVKKGCLPLHSV